MARPYLGDRESTVTLKVIKHSETNDAVLVSLDGERDNAVWLPLSQIEIGEGPTVNGVTYHDLTLPRWLAENRGLA